MFAHLAHLTHPADGALVLGVVLGPVKRTLLERCAAVDRCIARRADFELGELVKLNLDGVVGVALALGLGPPGLSSVSRLFSVTACGKTYAFESLGRTSAVGQHAVGEAER